MSPTSVARRDDLSPFRHKRSTQFAARHAPSVASLGETVCLSWVDHDTGNVMFAQTLDLLTFDQKTTLEMPSMTSTVLAAGAATLLMAWVDPKTQQICLMQSEDGIRWSGETRLGSQTLSAPALVYFRDHFCLTWRQYEDNRLHLMSSPNGFDWREESVFDAQTGSSPSMFVYEDQLMVAWSSHDGGVLLSGSAKAQLRQPSIIIDSQTFDPNLYVHCDQLYATWMDSPTGEMRLMHNPTGRSWQSRATLHERCVGSPTLTSLKGRLAWVWVRDDDTRAIHFAVEEVDDTGHTNRQVFSGDLQGHSTAINFESLSPTLDKVPYPYLGIVVLPSDMRMPEGQTHASLTANLGKSLQEVKAFWAEASYGKADITYEVYPKVVGLPGPMKMYLVRARPKIIEGSGATFPVTFQGGETLDLEGSNNYQVTVVFPAETMAVEQVAITINEAVGLSNYNGPEAEKPVAHWNCFGQLLIWTSGKVDPGVVLNVKGGTAVDMLGFGQNNIAVYEGSRTETNKLHDMLRDAVKAVLDTKANPAEFLSRFFGIAVCIADSIGWWTLHPNAPGLTQLAVLSDEKPFRVSHYFTTTCDGPGTHVHEVGHNLGLPDLYEEVGHEGLKVWGRYIGAEPGRWDVMDSGDFNHPTAWVKAYCSNPWVPKLRWISKEKIEILDSTKESVEALLVPNESPFPTNNPFNASHPGVPVCHAIKVVLDTNHAFYVENRQRGPYTHPDLGTVNYSKYLPGDGLVITDGVNDVATSHLPRSNVVLVHPYGLKIADIPNSIIDEVLKAASTSDKQFILSPYVPSEIPQWLADKICTAKDQKEIEDHIRVFQDDQIRAFYPVDGVGKEVILYQFPDGSGDIRVKILEKIGNGPYVYKVKATWGRPGSWFDLEVRKWQNPPPYETPDIWIDSEENGWDTYEHHDAALNPDVPGNPILNGDRPWVGHVNIVYARVWNRGDIPQNNVRVDFEVMVPPGQSPGYPFATDYIDIPAGGWAIAKGHWNPVNIPAEEHGCIVAKVEYKPWNLNDGVIGELNADNNSAQENITDFYLEKGSPYQEVTIPFEFANPLPEPVEMKLQAHGLKPGWTLTVDPCYFSLGPSERIEGEAILHADENVHTDDNTDHHPVISLEALVRSGCTWHPIGGFSMMAHPVYKTELDVGIDPHGSGFLVSAYAKAYYGLIGGANVAMRLIGPAQETISVTRAETDSEGHVNGNFLIDLDQYPKGTLLKIEVRVSPTSVRGPASVILPARW